MNINRIPERTKGVKVLGREQGAIKSHISDTDTVIRAQSEDPPVFVGSITSRSCMKIQSDITSDKETLQKKQPSSVRVFKMRPKSASKY